MMNSNMKPMMNSNMKPGSMNSNMGKMNNRMSNKNY